MSNLGDFLDIWHFYDNSLVFGDGSLGHGFKLKGKDISCATSEEINDFNKRLETMLSSVDEGMSIQVFYRLSSNVEDLIEKHSDLSKSYPKDCYTPILESRKEFFKNNQRSGRYFNPEIFLFIKGKPCGFSKRKLFSKQKDFLQVSEEEFKSHFSGFEKKINNIVSSLKSLSLLEEELSKKDWTKLLYEYFNFSRSEKLDPPNIRRSSFLEADSLLSQLFLTDITLYKNYLEIGDYKFKVLSLKSLPEETHAGIIDDLLKLPFHCWITQTMRMCDQSREYKNLQIKRRLNHSMASGSQNVSDLESESNLNQIESLLSEVLDSSEKIVESDLNVLIWGRSERELEEKEDEVLRQFKALNGCEGIVETYANFDAFIKLAPGVCRMNRPKKMKLSNLTHLLPVYSYWRGNEKPVCLLPNRDNVLVSMDFFTPELPNWNGLIVGSSGSGKSFALNSLILMFIGDQT